MSDHGFGGQVPSAGCGAAAGMLPQIRGERA